MFNPFLALLKQNGQKVFIERDGVQIAETEGLFNRDKTTSENYIGFMMSTDIKVDDWVVNTVDERFLITRIETQFFMKEPMQIRAFYLTEHSVNNPPQKGSTFHIENAYGSVIGNQSHFSFSFSPNLDSLRTTVAESDSADKQELQKLIDLVEMIVQNQVPASKGLLSRFSAVMERNSWLTSSILSALLGWLTTQIP